MRTIDLNADLGEGGDHDAALMALVSSANIACGGHAGDLDSIRRTVELAMEAKVAIGAHPGYEDRAHFGRRPMNLSSQEIRSLILRQLERILEVHPHLHHVKPHGALYHQSNHDESTADALVFAIAEIRPQTILYGPAGGALAKAASRFNLLFCSEGFIDRRYQQDGRLCPRTDERALIEDPDEAVAQALCIANRQAVPTQNGAEISLMARTLCVHGDSPSAWELLRLTRSALESAGFRIACVRNKSSHLDAPGF